MQLRLIIVSIFMLLVTNGYVFANEDSKNTQGSMMDGSMMKDNSMMQQGKESESKAVEVGNKICPVSGEKIPAPGEKGAMGEVVKYEYNRKIYNLCCPMCVKDFKKDPEKYSKIADDEVAKEKESK